MNSTLTLCSRYLHWIGKEEREKSSSDSSLFSVEDNDRKRSNIFLCGDFDPASKRGGLAGDFLVRSSFRLGLAEIIFLIVDLESFTIGRSSIDDETFD